MGTEETLSRILQELQKPDFATPALYFFSTVAQTMGAIIAIVLAAVYAIIPQIQNNNKNPGSAVLIRLLKKDAKLKNAVNIGFTAIALSVASLFIIYATGLSNTVAILILPLYFIATITLSIISCLNIWLFVSSSISHYNNLNAFFFYSQNNTLVTKDSQFNADILEALLLYRSFYEMDSYSCIDICLNFKSIIDNKTVFILYGNITQDFTQILNSETVSEKEIQHFFEIIKSFHKENEIDNGFGLLSYTFSGIVMLYSLYNGSAMQNYIQESLVSSDIYIKSINTENFTGFMNTELQKYKKRIIDIQYLLSRYFLVYPLLEDSNIECEKIYKYYSLYVSKLSLDIPVVNEIIVEFSKLALLLICKFVKEYNSYSILIEDIKFHYSNIIDKLMIFADSRLYKKDFFSSYLMSYPEIVLSLSIALKDDIPKLDSMMHLERDFKKNTTRKFRYKSVNPKFILYSNIVLRNISPKIRIITIDQIVRILKRECQKCIIDDAMNKPVDLEEIK